MIDSAALLNAPATHGQKQAHASGQEITETRRVLKMVHNERMGGMVPKWETITVTKKLEVERTLETAQSEEAQEGFESAMAYQSAQIEPEAGHSVSAEEAFGFGDLVDMVNPLHHIPLVGHVYRDITGDQIKPASKIMGGAIFGGPAGAAIGLVNVVIEEETGKDLAENAVALALNGEAPKFKNAAPVAAPERTLNEAVRIAEKIETGAQDLPGALLSFTDLSTGPKGFKATRVAAASGRTAGHSLHQSYTRQDIEPLMPREPITEVILRAMPEGRY